MKTWVILCLLCCFFGLQKNELYAQQLPEISVGTEYVVSFAAPLLSSTELGTHSPYQIHIIGSHNGTANITYYDSNGNAITPTLSVVVKKEAVTSVRVPGDRVVSNSRTIERMGIRIQSDVAVTVLTEVRFNGAGELSTHIPIPFLGTKYHVVSWPADRSVVKQASRTITPGFALITATEDNTYIDITPTWTLAASSDGKEPDWQTGAKKTILLHKYQTYLIYSKATHQDVDLQRADITGTRIESTKPISVQSGHTKGSVIHAADTTSFNGVVFGSPLHFLRNCIQDVVYPDEMAGTEYVVVPKKHTDLRVPHGRSKITNFHSDSGEVVRVIAVNNNTSVFKLDNNGVQKEVAILQEGQYYTDSNVVKTSVYRSSLPTLCVQYSKSWCNYVPSNLGKTIVEEIEGHPTTEAGMPAMALVPPTNRWVSYAMSNGVEGKDNFVNIVIASSDSSKVEFVKNGPGGTKKIPFTKVNNTDFSYFSTKVPAGVAIISANAGAKFYVSTYNSLDGINQGSAGATVQNVNLANSKGEENIVLLEVPVVENNTCGKRNFEYVLSGTSGLAQISFVENTNSVLRLAENTTNKFQGNFEIYPLDNTKPASAIVRVVAKNGTYKEVSYSSASGVIIGNNTLTDLGTLPLGLLFDVQIPLYNSGVETVNISDVGINGEGLKTLSTNLPLQIIPHDTVNFSATMIANSVGKKYLDVTINDKCVTKADSVFLVSIHRGEVKIILPRHDSIQAGSERILETSIKNTGTVDVQLDSVWLTSNVIGQFMLTENPSVPHVLNVGDSVSYSVRCSTSNNNLGLQYGTIHVIGNNKTVSLQEQFVVTVIGDTLSILDDDKAGNKGPYAISRGSSLNLRVQPESIFSILTTTGKIVFTGIVPQEQIGDVQRVIKGLSPGMYVLQFQSKVGIQRQQLLITP